MYGFKYRVLGYRTTGNAKRLYQIQDLNTGEIFEEYAKFFKQEGDDAFINVSVRNGTNFSVLKSDKGSPEYEINQARLRTRIANGN